ncbi:MAG: cytochrome c oxidase subunit II [Bacteroidetes bacterium]|nr:MAG: cytochrome c oxidase subunit II [Bacteroidota bacterium]
MYASNFVEGVDFSLYLILAISVFFLVGITAVMIYFLFRYSKKNNPVATNITHNNTLEVIWTVIPTILVVIMFWYGWTGYKPMLTAPDNAMEIDAIGQMWKWSFEYPNGKVSDTLVVPINEPVKLNLFSKDVLHSLYIPAFRIKQDVVPGSEKMMWFTAQKLGSYDILCAEYCGQLHAYMLSTITVVERRDYEIWLETKAVAGDEHPGLTLLKRNACLSCHTQDGTRLVGPSFKGLVDRKETVVLEDGTEKEVVADRAYIANSIKNPNSEIVKSFQKGLMTNYADILSDEDIEQIIDFIETMK